MRAQLSELNVRAAVVRESVERLARSLQSKGLRPNARFTEPEALMNNSLEAAQSALMQGDLESAKQNSAKAEQQIQVLEKLFNR